MQMLSSILFAAIGVVGAGYSVIVSGVAINQGPSCEVHIGNGTSNATEWRHPFENGWDKHKGFVNVVDEFSSFQRIWFIWVSSPHPLCRNYLSDKSLWDTCLQPKDVVPWHLTLFSMLLIMGLIQIALCAVQVINGLLGALCGDCCGCCGGGQ